MDPGMQKAFTTLKEKLCAQPILQYADTTKGYTLYTDASKYGWAGVLTQLHTTVIDGKTITTDHPVAYVSGLFRGSQINWAALTKEAYAIYMSVKKLSFYLTDAEVLLKSDHLPLKKFLQKNTLNTKVNNWAMELEAMYQMVAQQLIHSRERYVKSNRYNKIPDHGILVGDLVLVKDHTVKSFEPKYKEDFGVVQVYGMNALQVLDKRGRLHNVHIKDIKKLI